MLVQAGLAQAVLAQVHVLVEAFQIQYSRVEVVVLRTRDQFTRVSEAEADPSSAVGPLPMSSGALA